VKYIRDGENHIKESEAGAERRAAKRKVKLAPKGEQLRKQP